ncbi:Ubiquitin homeostasis protein lub1 [Nosema granulosis]|uniref:Ubiquitin homeostasis protein lub1 n=1 Tax=Nosema granulosis TaxID=83296 RepID=A0A9P6H1E1_9MICR|nr:Ubiquitin homeostasis protein lub1 [Nosema granulosis]
MLEVTNILNYSKKDLKDVYVDNNLIIAVGRDEVVFVNDLTTNAVSKFNPHSGNVNSVTYSNGNIFCGCQNGLINIYNLETNTKSNLFGHSNNVCTLEIRNNILLSGSWDHTLKIWYIPELRLIDSIEHPGTVWCVKFIDDNTFVTGCADKVVRIFNNNVLVSSYSLHNFCIRGVSVVDKVIYSIDNEGTLLKTTMGGELLAHASFKDFMFSVEAVGEHVVCCGENGKIYLLDGNLAIVDETTAPCVSCWKVYSLGDKVYICGSDGSLYIFLINNGLKRGLNNEKFYRQNETAKNGDVVDSTPSQEFVSGDERFRVVDNNVYQFVNEEWVLLGEKKEEAEAFDYSFSVELDNKFYTLAFNKKDNVYQVADDFLLKNKLNDEYRDQIVDYIRSNFGSKGDYKLYDTINVEGVHKLLGGYDSLVYIFNNLKTPNKKYEKLIEKELSLVLETGPRFVALDLYRFFVIHGLSFDLTFLFRFQCKDRKEALAFVRLLTVLYYDSPFNIESLHPVVQRLKDSGLLKSDDLDDYYNNRSIKK